MFIHSFSFSWRELENENSKEKKKFFNFFTFFKDKEKLLLPVFFKLARRYI